MSKVNFVSEFNSFMRFARDNSLSLRERMLWIALFYVANDRATYNELTQEYEWPDGFIQVSNGELNLYCCLDKRAIETLRNGLKQKGLIDFRPGQKNKKNPSYRLIYLTGEAGYKNAPNNVPNNAPSYAPNNTPSHAPDYAGNAGFLGTKMHPTMPPYTQNKYINPNHAEAESGFGSAAGQRTYCSDRNDGVAGLVDLNAENIRCEGFVPLPWEGGGR